MSNITSPWMSTANIGSWDYYIFTENNHVVQVMNGVAAWFNSGGGAIVQNAALLGGLVLLIYSLMGHAVRSNKVNSMTVGIWLIVVAAAGIQGRAVVTNVYTGQVSVVDNVPAIALVPASIFSKAGYRIFQGIETAYQTTSGSYMSVSQYGFMGPLDLLLTLRSNDTPGLVAPHLYRTLRQALTDCGWNDPNIVPPNGLTFENAPDALGYLREYGRESGLTIKYTQGGSTSGTLTTCKEAFEYLDTQYKLIAQGNPGSPLLLLNAKTTKLNPQDPNGRWGPGAFNEAYDLLIAGGINAEQNSITYTTNALVASYVKFSQDCFQSHNSMTSPNECANGALAVAEGLEKWKTEATSAGQGFLKTMFTSMGFLQVMFFSFFPFVIVYAVATGIQSAKILGGYIFFGIWTQSWVIVVAPIQSYIQGTVTDIVRKTTGGQGITIANADPLYSQLSTQLAIASDMMASAQMMSLALLSGSIYAMVGMANKWSGASKMNTESLQKSVVQEAPMVQSQALTSNQMVGSTGSAFNRGNVSITTASGSYDVNDSAAASQVASSSSGQGLTDQGSESLQKTLNGALGAKYGSSIKQEQSHEAAAKANSARKVMAGVNQNLFGSLFGATGAAAALGLSSDRLASLTGNQKSAIGLMMQDGASKEDILKMSDEQLEQLGASVNEGTYSALMQEEQKNQGFMSRLLAGDEKAVATAAGIAIGVGSAALIATGVGAKGGIVL